MNWTKVYSKLKKAMKEESFLAEYIKMFIMECLTVTDVEDLKRLKKLRSIK